MFATPSSPFTPHRPSPLNISTPPWTMSPTHNHTTPTPTPFKFNIQTEPIQRHAQNHASPIHLGFSNPPSSPTPTRKPKPHFEARYASIANPLQNANGLARSKTRKMFMNRVRNERDAGRFEARGEQMMHMEHLADRRRWEETMAREGEVVDVEVGDEDDMLPDEGDALDEFISQEEAMEVAMRDLQGAQGAQGGRVNQLRGNGNGNEVPFSDDDYDDIFMELQDSQDMDMS